MKLITRQMLADSAPQRFKEQFERHRGSLNWLGMDHGETIDTLAKLIRPINPDDVDRMHMGSKRPIFVLGAGVDKPAPKSLTPEQSQERFKKRHPERVKEIQTNSYRRSLMREKGHGWLSTLIMTR